MGPGLTILDRIIEVIIDPTILLIFTLGFLVFLWGMLEFMVNPEDGGVREKGKKHMLWGIVGMFIMISVGGIISLIQDTFDLRRPTIQGGPYDPGTTGGVNLGGDPFSR